MSQECTTALSMGLAPPPYVYNDFFTTITKRFYDSGYKISDIGSITHVPSSPSSSACAWADTERLLRAMDISSKTGLWWPIEWLALLVPCLAGGVMLLFMYRHLSKPKEVKSSPGRSIEATKIMQPPSKGLFAGLRRRIRTMPSTGSELDHHGSDKYAWREACSTAPDDTDNSIIDPPDTASSH